MTNAEEDDAVTIKVSWIFYLLMGLGLSLFAGFLTFLVVNQGAPFPLGVWAFSGLLFAITCAVLFRMRIVVNDVSIAYSPGIGLRKGIRFEEIGYSRTNPIVLRIFRSGWTSPCLAIRLQPFPQKKVEWLLSLTKLNIG